MLWPIYLLMFSSALPTPDAGLPASEPKQVASNISVAASTPAQAVQTIQHDNNWDNVAAAWVVAAENPTSRGAVIDFFAHPTEERVWAFIGEWKKSGLLSDDWPANDDGRETNNLQRHMLESYAPLLKSIAESNDPQKFEIIKAMAESQFVHGFTILPKFSKYVKPGSVVEPLFLDYATEHPFDGYLEMLLSMNTDVAFKRVMEALDATPLQYFQPNSVHPRYSIYNIAAARKLLLRSPIDARWGTVEGLLGQQSLEGPLAQVFENADPSVYALLLSFITDAETLDYPPAMDSNVRQFLAERKAELKALQKLHPEAQPIDSAKAGDYFPPVPLRDMPYNPYHYESGLYPPFPWQAKVLIPITILLVLWWFWHEWKTWPK